MHTKIRCTIQDNGLHTLRIDTRNKGQHKVGLQNGVSVENVRSELQKMLSVAQGPS